MAKRNLRQSILLPVLLILAVAGASLAWILLSSDTSPTSGNVVEGIQVHVLDVGNADCMYITAGDRHMLIDAGDKENAGIIISYLEERKVRKLDLVVATHPHADHIGGMAAVLTRFEVGNFLLSFMPEGYEPTTQTYLNLLQTLDERDIPVTDVKPGDQFTLGEMVVDILGPVRDFTDINNQSVVCKVTFGDQQFLFMGDAEREAEQALLEAGADLTADFIKIGHHGSRTSTQKAFIRQVNPSVAVIPCGAGNSYGHPHEETIDLLNSLKLAVYRSDIHGTIVVSGTGQGELKVSTERAAA